MTHEEMMRDNSEYRAGYQMVKEHQNSRYYKTRHAAAELREIAQHLASYWNPSDLNPLDFSLGAAAALLELANEKGSEFNGTT